MLFLLVTLLGGCTPTCNEVCRHIVACGNEGTERMSAAECAESCESQEALYAGWTDTELREDFDERLRCYDEATCEELAAGSCYDAEVWTY